MDCYVSWAQNEALAQYTLLGTWEAVAAELAPYLKMSGTSWWRVAQGEYVTRERINALRLHAGLRALPTLRVIESCPTCDGDHGLKQIPDCAKPARRRAASSAPHQADIRPRLPLDPQARIAKLQALLRQAEAELQEAT